MSFCCWINAFHGCFFCFCTTLNAMTALLVLGVVNNDKRDTLNSKLQFGLPALEECIKTNKQTKTEIQLEKAYCCYGKTWLCHAATARSWSAPGAAACALFSPDLQQFPTRKRSIILGSTRIHHCFHLTAASSRQWRIETSWQGRKQSLVFCTTERIPCSLQSKVTPWHNFPHCRRSHTSTSNRFTIWPFTEPEPPTEKPFAGLTASWDWATLCILPIFPCALQNREWA